MTDLLLNTFYLDSRHCKAATDTSRDVGVVTKRCRHRKPASQREHSEFEINENAARNMPRDCQLVHDSSITALSSHLFDKFRNLAL